MSGKMHEDEIKRFQVNFQSASRLFESRKAFSNSFFLFSLCLLYLLVEVFIKVSIQSILVMNVEEDGRFLYLCFFETNMNNEMHRFCRTHNRKVTGEAKN